MIERRPLTRAETVDMLVAAIDSRLWKTADGDLQLRLFSRYEAETVRAALVAFKGGEAPPSIGAWEVFDDYMPPDGCVLITADKAHLPIILHDKDGRWWIRDPLRLPDSVPTVEEQKSRWWDFAVAERMIRDGDDGVALIKESCGYVEESKK